MLAAVGQQYIRVNARNLGENVTDDGRSETPINSEDNQVANVWKLMREYWDAPKPKLIISVTGGAKDFNTSKRLLKSFKRGLMRVATTSGK